MQHRILLGASLLLLALIGCSSPTGGDAAKTITITSLGWTSENIATEYWQNTPPTATAFYNFWINYQGNITAADVEYARVNTGWGGYWNILAQPSYFSTTSKVIGGYGHWYLETSPASLPIGPLKVEVKLTNGTVATYTAAIPAPGTKDVGTTTSMYTEDEATPGNGSPMVRRAEVDASAASKDATAKTVKVGFSISDAKVLNGLVEYSDASKKYVGRSAWFKDPVTGATSTDLFGAGAFSTSGAANLVTAADAKIDYATGKTFADIAIASVVLFDGKQYTPRTDGNFAWDNLSRSTYVSFGATIPVTPPATGTAPTANAGVDKNSLLGATVTLTGTSSVATATYSWLLVSKPTGSTATLSSPTATSPTLVPDKSGAYRMTLETTAGGLTSVSDEVVVYAYKRRVTDLPANIVDVEYDKVHDRLVVVSSAPNKLTLLDPATGTSVSTSLGYAPLSLALSPDAGLAAVGHNANISVVAISTATPSLNNTWTLSGAGPSNYTGLNITGLAFNDKGSIFCFPDQNQWIDLRIINASTGVQSFASVSLYAGVKARTAPSGKSIYYFDTLSSPADIRYIGVGTVPLPSGSSFDSKYHGDYPIGGADLWFDEAGQVIVGTGTVFSATESKSSTTDLQYVGSLSTAAGGVGIKSLSHSAAAVNGSSTSLYALLPANASYSSTTTNDTNVILADKFFSGLVTLPLPLFIQGTTATRAHGYYTNWKSDGSELYTVVKSDGAANASFWDLIVY